MHSASAYISANPGKVLINIDLANAFNSMSRIAMIDRLRRHAELAELLPFIRLFYLEEGSLFVQQGANPFVVPSRTGSQQGCTFGSLLWSAGWQDALEDFASRTDFAVSYVDDGTFIMEPEAAAPFLQHVANIAAAHGGELQLRKCIAYCAEDLPECPTSCAASGSRASTRVCQPSSGAS